MAIPPPSVYNHNQAKLSRQKGTNTVERQVVEGGLSAATSYAIVTPSWAPDFERCRLLAESVRRHLPEGVHHYILIDRCDKSLFACLEGSRTHLILKQDVLPKWLIHVPRRRKWWISLKGLPVRGWIIQQLAKLSVNKAVVADVYIFVDSDAFFMRDYDPASTIVDGKLPLFRQQKEEVRVAWNIRWHQVAARLLGLEPRDSYDTSYVGHAMYWKRENLEKLQARIQEVTGKPWISAVARQLYLSEYVLYGVFVEHILGDSSGQYFRSSEESLNYWSESPIDEAGLRELKSNIAPNVSLVMVSAKAPVSVEAIRRVFLSD